MQASFLLWVTIYTCICLRHYSSLEVASEYFRSGADKVSIGSDAVYAAEAYIRTGVCKSVHDIFKSIPLKKKDIVKSIVPFMYCLSDMIINCSISKVKSGKSSLEQISRVYGNQVFFYFWALDTNSLNFLFTIYDSFVNWQHGHEICMSFCILSLKLLHPASKAVLDGCCLLMYAV